MTKRLLIPLLFVLLCSKFRAQIDTSFWFVAPDISALMGESPIILHIQTYSQPSVVFLRQPALSATAAVNTSLFVNAASTLTFNLTPYLLSTESAPVNTISAKGFYISSKEAISIYYTIGNQSTTNREMISLKGQRALGTDFYLSMPAASGILTHTLSDGGVGFDVVATEPGITVFLCTPRANCVGHPKNITFARLLLQGETFSVMDNNSVNPSELAGTIISSNKLIGVTVKGSVRASANGCPSYFTDQITPSDMIGSNYVVLRGDGSTDVAYILAPQNATSFTLSTSTGTLSWLVNSSETFSVNISDPITYIVTDKPVYLFHLSGYGCKLSGAQLAPVFCAGSYSTAFIRLSSDSLNLNVCTRSGFQNSFTLTSNGNTVNVAANAFSVVPGSAGALVAARLFFPASSITVGSYNELRNSKDLFGLALHNGGSQGGSAYAQVSNFITNTYVNAHTAPTATTCANNPFALNGIIGGGPITGLWSLVDGYGTFLNGSTQYSSNVYVPSLLDTTNNNLSIPVGNRYVKIILSSTGNCQNLSDTLKLKVLQPPIVTAGSSSVICGNFPTINFNGNVYGATNQGFWSSLPPASGSFIAGATSFTPTYQLSQNDTTQTQLQFVLTSTNNGGCNPGTASVTVFINKPPIVIAGTLSPLTICSNNSTLALNGVVSGTASTTGIWHTTGSGLFSPGNLFLAGNYLPSANDLSSGSVWLTLESTNNGICFPTRDSIQVLFIDPSYVNAGSDLNACTNNPRAELAGVITGTLTNTVLWLGGSGQFSPTNTALTCTYTGSPAEVAAGFVTLTLSTTNNGVCFGTEDLLQINFQQKPTANFSVNAVCLGQLSEFSDQSVNSSTLGTLNLWAWDFGDNSPMSYTTQPLHAYTTVGSYSTTLIVRNNFDCYDTVQKVAVVNALPTPAFFTSRDCSGSAQLIHFTDNSSTSLPDVIPGSGYYWDFGGFGFSVAKDTSVIFPSEGIYNISHRVSTDKGCTAVISKTLEITPRPVARFIYLSNAQVGLGATVQFRDTSSYAVTWIWSFGNGDSSRVQHPSYYYKENGKYPVKLTVTDRFACPSSYSLEVKIATIVTEIVKLVPNVITPNGDGKNDVWRLDFIDVFFPKAEIEIFNRWGEKMFRSVGYSNAWDGTYKGEPLPVGAYFYMINLNDGETPVIKGSITLVK
ncbi:MAG: PKD domain-containing protein [bacterium]|nr:PKD domain-containing protein [bacterium]